MRVAILFLLLASAAMAAGNTPTLRGTPPPQITIPVPGADKGGSSPSDLRTKFLIEQARLEKLEKLVYTANPDLKKTEQLAALLYTLRKQKETAARAGIDKYLKDHKMTVDADLPKFRLSETAKLAMDILAPVVVSKDSMKKYVLTVLQKGKPVYPAEFEKQFPGKKQSEVDPEALLAFYKAQLKARADQARPQLSALVKETGLPQPILQAQSEIVQIQCGLIVLREYLLLSTPQDLTAQRELMRNLERKLNPQAGAGPVIDK